MRQQNVKSQDANVAALPRPLSPAAAALGKMFSRAWSLPPQRNQVAVERDVQVPMSDGVVLLADHYLPVSVASAAAVLVRCPYGRTGPFALQNAQILAERGYHVLMQSCRGTFGSGGEFEPMRHEITDGQDTVAWLREQSWFDGRLATYGASYLGFVQWALAMDPPPELVAAIVHIGPHDFSRSAFRNGVFDLYNYIGWSDLVAHQESAGRLRALVRTATAERRLRPVLDRLPVAVGVRDLLGREPTWSRGGWRTRGSPTRSGLRCSAAPRCSGSRSRSWWWLAGRIFSSSRISSSTARSPPGACPPDCWSDRGPTWTSRPRAAPRSWRAWPGSTATPAREDPAHRLGGPRHRPGTSRSPGRRGAHLGWRRGRGGVA